MKHRVLVALVALVALVLLIITTGACTFGPDLGDGTFACGTGTTCPPGYGCAVDGRCYRPGSGPGLATIDGGGDGPVGPLSTLLVTDVSTVETDAVGEAVFNVRLVPASTVEVKVDYTTVDDTAKVGEDYAAASGTLTFPPGATSQLVKVSIQGDKLVEPQEKFLFVLSNPRNALLDVSTAGRASGVIIDNDTPGLVVDDITVNEGNTGLTSAVFTVTLTGTFTNVVSVSYAAQDGTALVGTDYLSTSGTLVFKPGDQKKSVTVPIKTDTRHGEDRVLLFTLSNAVGALILDGQAQGTIKDDDVLPSLTISDPTLNAEGNSGSATMTFDVTLSSASTDPITVAFASGGGTAGALDYAPTSGSLTFDPGTTTKTIAVTIQSDVINEPNETFEITLSNAVGATLTKAVGVGTITDDDELPAVTIDDVALSEGNTGQTKAFAFAVHLSSPSGQIVTVNYATRDETASAATDYIAAAAGASLTFAPGEILKTIVVTVNGDGTDEGVETFAVDLAIPANGNARLVGTSAIGIILNDDSALPSISINDVEITEGNSPGTVQATFTVALSPGINQEVRVSYATSNGTADAGSDYVSATAELIFAPLQTTKTVSITINGDGIYELDETFFVDLFGATNANIIDAQGVGKIVNDEGLPAIAIGAVVAQPEGDSGSTPYAFPVTLSRPSSQAINVSFATADGTAIAPGDYSVTTGILTFAPGETTKNVNVSIVGDAIRELDETFVVNLTTPVNATIQTAAATGTIQNDDAEPTLSISDVTIAEGNPAGGASTTTAFTFIVTLSAQSSQTVTVNWATLDGTAASGSDFTIVAPTPIMFAPGETSKMVTVDVITDAADEPHETFSVVLSTPANATISDGTGVGTILNDDSLLPALSIDDVAILEGGAVVFTVTLSPATAQQVTVQYATTDGTATIANNDYAAKTNVLTFAPNETSQTITIQTQSDVTSEPDETFFVNLSSPTNATIFDGQGQGTILNDDVLPTIAINDVALVEGNTGNKDFIFTLTLSATSGQDVTVDFVTGDGTASAPADYTAKAGVATIVAGTTTTTVIVKVSGDFVSEQNETFFVNLSNPINANILDAQGLGTIQNDDTTPGVSIDDPSIVEGNTGTKTLTFTLTLAAASGQACSVSYTTVNGTATAPADYVAKSALATIPQGQTSTTINITIKGDTLVEGDEVFYVDISNASGCTITKARGTGTILDND